MRIEEIFTAEELLLIDSGQYRPGRLVLDAKLALVFAIEREACAKVCDAEVRRETQNQNTAEVEGVRLGARFCAAAIRARGQSNV